MKIHLLILVMFLTPSLWAQKITKMQKNRIYILLPADEADYYETGDELLISEPDDEETNDRVKVLKSHDRSLVVKCISTCNQSWQTEEPVKLSELSQAKTAVLSPDLRRAKIWGLSLGMPFKSGYGAFNNTQDAYDMSQSEGYYLDIYRDWLKEQFGGQFYKYGLSVYTGRMQSQRKHAGQNSVIEYVASGVALRLGLVLELTESITYGATIEKRLSFSEELKVKTELETFDMKPLGNNNAFVDVITHEILIKAGQHTSIKLAVDDEKIVGPIGYSYPNIFSRFDRTGFSAYKIGVQIEK